jgi:hypothetical protein
MIGSAGIWAFVGLKEAVFVALVALALYGRSGLQKHPYVRMLRPWLSPTRRTTSSRASSPSPAPSPASEASKAKWEGRVFWFLAIVAATAVAAWIVTRTLILADPGPSR